MRTIEAWPPAFRFRRHDWEELANGDIHEAERGIDFDGEPESFRSSVLQAARRMDIAVRTRVVRERELPGKPPWFVVFQFFPGRTYRDGPPADTPDAFV